MKPVDIHPAAGLADSLEIDNPYIIFIIFEIYPQNTLFPVIDRFEVLHIPRIFKDPGNLILYPGGWDIDLLMLGFAGISDSG